MSLRRAKSAEEYAEWVKQAKFEVQDLKDCLLYDMDEMAMTSFPAFLEPLEEGINAVFDAMCNGSYTFGREDLPFMDVAADHESDIPFHTLLKQINETHRKGLEVEEED